MIHVQITYDGSYFGVMQLNGPFVNRNSDQFCQRSHLRVVQCQLRTTKSKSPSNLTTLQSHFHMLRLVDVPLSSTMITIQQRLYTSRLK